MARPLVLASGSEIRAQLLRNAGLSFETTVARLDEDSLKASLIHAGTTPRDIADALAEGKAVKVSTKHPGALVIGCDQVLDFDGRMLSKPKDEAEARQQLQAMQGRRHSLFSAAVLCVDGRPVWRHVGQARLTMRDVSDEFLDGYVKRNWDSIRHSVGAYKLEEEGVRLFSRVEGDYFNVLGLPLLEILSYLGTVGDIET